MKFSFEIRFTDTEYIITDSVRNLTELDSALEESVKSVTNNPKEIIVRIREECGLSLGKISIERVMNLDEQKALLLRALRHKILRKLSESQDLLY